MITKKRLKELIEQNATIYLQNFREKIIPYTLNENIDNALNYYDVDDECLYLMKVMNNEEDDCKSAWLLKELFETEEDAEWELEFGNITRTETLGLLTWEQFNYFKDTESCYGGIGTDFFRFIGYDYYIYYLSKLDNRICLTKEDETGYYPVKEWELTKENYIEACRICKKVFLNGEEI